MYTEHMDFIQKILTRYHADLLHTTVAIIYLLYFWYKNFELVSLDFLLQFSTFERLLVFFLIAFVIGKVVATLGSIFIKTTIWLAFQHNKAASWKQFKNDFILNVSFSNKKIQRKVAVGSADLFVFLNQHPLLQRESEAHENAQEFWFTMVGFTLVAMFSSVQFYELVALALLFLFSTAVAIRGRLLYRGFRSQCSLLAFEAMGGKT